ncbi:MAG: NADH dehydrogenase subunit N [Candidatus Methanohalarchaeum thermophilum]|uniref:NADH dehydrogenase subunit N n=1 Tax=Methanohalarchaeum thermophilum TaxID=1903181 RepID=A0A1Q6DX79_METT1|nr:MAG: NADH dehydrogenase subunit N [Candidatus Methanohalarchaeum thermophilum]
MYFELTPYLIMLIVPLTVVAIDLVINSKRIPYLLTIIGILISISLFLDILLSGTSFNKYMISVNKFSIYLSIIFLIGGILTATVSNEFLESAHAEFYSLLSFSLLGMMLAVSTKNLIMIYIGMELASLSLIPLVSFFKKKEKSTEAALKYLILNGISSALFIYGISLFYVSTSTTNLIQLSKISLGPLSLPALAFVVVGIGFKISAVPFHFWAPDTFEGAPTPITSFLSSSSKKMGFGVALLIFPMALASYQANWTTVFAILAVGTMTLGNIAAIKQENIKRMLAYSSISQSGYILIGLAVATKIGLAGSLIQILAHNLGSGAAFILIGGIALTINTELIEEFKGLGKSSPLIALALTICLLSLGGIPPFAGFLSKFILFLSAIEENMLWLAVIGIINSAISIYYYANVIKNMYFYDKQIKSEISRPFKIIAVFAILSLIAVGLGYDPILELAIEAANTLT